MRRGTLPGHPEPAIWTPEADQPAGALPGAEVGVPPSPVVAPGDADRSSATTPAPRAVGTPAEGGMPVASLGQRVAASLVDSAVFFVFYLLLQVLTMALVAVVGSMSSSAAQVVSVILMLVVLAATVWIVVSFVVAIGRLGQTPGKRALGVQIVDADSGGPIGPGRAVTRMLVQALMGVPCYLGYISYFTDSTGRNRAFHDKAANDVVIRTAPVPIVQAVRDVLTVLTRKAP